MSFDANAHRDASLQGWEEAAAGWVRSQELLREFGAPVSHWMIDAVAPQPGQRVLELAAGLGETGLLAAELVAPVGGVIISDQAEAMLDGARAARARSSGSANVEFQVLNAEWIDLPLASVDVVLCRWGYMLMADPAAALARDAPRAAPRRARRRWPSGTRVERNPWALLPAAGAARARADLAARARRRPGPFALGDAGRVRELLEEAGFAEIRVRGARAASPPRELRRVLGVDARPLAQRPRRGARRARRQRSSEIEARRRRRASRPTKRADGALEIPGAHARRRRERLSGRGRALARPR